MTKQPCDHSHIALTAKHGGIGPLAELVCKNCKQVVGRLKQTDYRGMEPIRYEFEMSKEWTQ